MASIIRPFGIAAVCGLSIGGYMIAHRLQDKMKTTTHTTDVYALFDKIDHDHKGYVNKRDLRDELAKVSAMPTLASDLLMGVADADHDGKISREEWARLCNRVEYHTSVVPHAASPDPSAHTKEVMHEQMQKEAHHAVPPKKSD